MAFRSHALLGIHITGTKIRLVEGRKTDSALLINRFESIPYGEGEDIFRALHGALKSSRATEVHLTLPPHAVNHFFFSLPALRKKEAKQIVERELAQTASFDMGENFFDFTIPADGDSPLDYAVLTAPKDDVLAIIAECQRAGKKPVLVTSYPFSLQHILSRFTPEFENEIYASLHIEDERGFLSIFKKGNLVFTRSFSLKTKIPMPSGFGGENRQKVPPTFVRIIQETSRSLLFFKQHSHGLMAKGIIVSGNITDSESLKTAMQEELGVEVHFLQTGEKKGLLTILKQRDKPIPPQSFMEYAVALGLIYASPRDTVNLIPETILKRKTIFWGRLTMTIVLITLFAGTAFTHLMLKKQASILENAVASQEKIHQEMIPIVAHIKKIKGNRTKYQSLHQFSKRVITPPVFWTPFWKDISQIIPDQLVVDQAEFIQDNHIEGTYLYKLSGEINTSSAESAQDVYQKFITLLFSSPCIKEGQFSPPEILPAKIKSQGQPLAGHDVLGSLKSKIREIEQKGATLTYHLNGKLKINCAMEKPQ